VNEKYFRSICLYLGLSTIKDKVLGNGLIQIVAGALGYIIDNEEKRWYDFMNNDFQPSRDKDNQCFTDGMSMLSISEPNSNYYINEDFESYQVNTFPSSGGWILKYNGAGNDKQRIVTDFHVSGSKSMRMEGKLNPPYWWAACMYHSLNMSNSTFYIEGMILGSASGTGVLEDGGGLEFSNRDEGTWGTGYAGVGLDAKTGTIGCSIGSASQVIQSYTANEWYKIKMRFDVPNSSLDVWIDDVQKISGLHGTLSQLGFTSISLSACHGHTIFYYDDIKVWKE